MPELIGIGTNITECLRIARLIERHGELFVNRIFTPEEIEFCHSRTYATQHFTGRWAAKEAILKALGTGWRKGISGGTLKSARHGASGRSWRSAAP